ncbi:MAG TPA: undecaprenyl-diphosphatase UppP [Planctomycetota bacterium]|nr:undecaprenyl-diphosphatase UppP [Planctomycetota bacterium]
MTLLAALVLGIVQGLTEFIPVSSTAHLLVGEALFRLPPDDPRVFAFTVLVQLGTLVSLLVYFRADVVALLRAFFARPFSTAANTLGWYVILGTVPALVAGKLLKPLVEDLFKAPLLGAAIRLFVAAGVLTLAEYLGRRTRKLDSMRAGDAAAIGLFQVLAIFPGCSRSGSTIAGGMLLGFERPSAARFAFLLSIPVMLAVGVYESKELVSMPDLGSFLPPLAVGFVAAAVVGWLAIGWLISYLSRRSLYVFAVYCALGGLACLLAA